METAIKVSTIFYKNLTATPGPGTMETAVRIATEFIIAITTRKGEKH